jgi:hypothetical protein
VTEVGRALEQIAQIHEHLARNEVYRGWRPVPVASSGVVGVAAAAWQSMTAPPLDPWTFVRYWLVVGAVALIVGCSEIVWHYVARATDTERRRSRQVIGQFLPALVAGAFVTGALVRLSPSLVSLLPGLWALLYGVAIFAARPFVPRASAWVGVYYWTAGGLLLWSAPSVAMSPWAVGGTFGVGQWLAAATIHWSAERD